MKHKTESWNGATNDSGSSSVRRSLTRAGLQLGQLSHAVSGALSTLQSGASSRGAAQNRMRALLNQDRALLSHRACGAADLEDAEDAAELPVTGGKSRGAAQNRMRELLNQDRAMLALREARRREDPASEPLDDDFAAELVQMVDREWSPVQEAASVPPDLSRMTCVGATTSFPVEAEVATVCTPGPVAVAAAAAVAVVDVAAKAEAVVISKPVVVAAAPKAAARAADADDSEGDPIRTRGMAKLLALQGYKDRALSIYDELLAAEPDNTELRAEADRLRK